MQDILLEKILLYDAIPDSGYNYKLFQFESAHKKKHRSPPAKKIFLEPAFCYLRNSIELFFISLTKSEID